MGRLSSAILDTYRNPTRRKYFGISSISPCPRETYLSWIRFNRIKDGLITPEVPNPQHQLLMDDGHFSEAEIVELIRRTGRTVTHTGKNQTEVHVGKANIAGHPDGFIHELDHSVRLLEVKSRNYQTYKKFVSGGLEAFQRMKCQVQLYLNSYDLPHKVEVADIVFKHKESVSLYDIEVSKDVDYAGKIIEQTDEIMLGSWEPKPVKTPLCDGCEFFSLCWGAHEIDARHFRYLPLKDVSEKYMQGLGYTTLGEEMIKEAKEELMGALGDGEELLTDGLRVQKVEQMRRNFNRNKFIKDKGEEEYNRYCDFVSITYPRVTPL